MTPRASFRRPNVFRVRSSFDFNPMRQLRNSIINGLRFGSSYAYRPLDNDGVRRAAAYQFCAMVMCHGGGDRFMLRREPANPCPPCPGGSTR